MKLVEIKCPNCHSTSKIDSEEKKFTCQYCRTTTLIDEEVVKVEITDKDREEQLKIARTYLNEFEDYDKAYELYVQLSTKYPYEPEVWIGIVKSITDNYTIIDNENISEIEDAMSKYMKIEKNEELRTTNFKNYEKYMLEIKHINRSNKETKKTAFLIALIMWIVIMLTIGLFL